MEGRRKIQATLDAEGVRHTWHEFNGQHAFIRDEGHRYDPELAMQCHGLALGLSQRKLGEGDRPSQRPDAREESRH
jgi:carboxymethylenebutenolidase